MGTHSTASFSELLINLKPSVDVFYALETAASKLILDNIFKLILIIFRGTVSIDESSSNAEWSNSLKNHKDHKVQ